MLTIDHTEVIGLEPAIRGMRNPKNSWSKSDSLWEFDDQQDEWRYHVGNNDHDLMMRLAAGGPVHAKYRRMIIVYADITAPLYWFKEFDTYKVGTVANSCSTMHKIHSKELTLDDFSYEHLAEDSMNNLLETIRTMNKYREEFLETGNKKAWWQMIQLLPTNYNQKRTAMMSYEVLVGIYKHRKDHKLDEWHTFCDWIKSLPYSEIITGEINAEIHT